MSVSFQSQAGFGLGLSKRDLGRYSITKLIHECAEGSGPTGVERELSVECEKRFGKTVGQAWIPFEALSVRTMLQSTGTLGGNLVASEILATSFVDELQPRMVVGRAGARVLSGLVGDVQLPRLRTGATATWMTSELAPATASNLYVDQVGLSVHELVAEVDVSRKLMIQSTPSCEALVIQDIQRKVAQGLDKAALAGTGASGQPSGCLVSSSNLITVGDGNGVSFSTFGVTCYASLVSMEAAVASSNVEPGRCSWITNPGMRGALRQAPLAATGDAFCWIDVPGAGIDGKLLGARAWVTTQVPQDLEYGSSGASCSAIMFGDFSDVLLAYFGPGIALTVDPYTLASTRVCRFFCSLYCDTALRNQGSVGALVGVKP